MRHKEAVIESLLRYCEESVAQPHAYCMILTDRVSGPSLQKLVDYEILESRQKMEPAFHTLWGHLRERDWRGLHIALQQEPGKIEPRQDRAKRKEAF